MKKSKLIISIGIAAALVLAAVVVAVLVMGQEKTPDFGTLVTEHQWKLHPDWKVFNSDAGEESVVAESSGTTSSWNLEYSMGKNWCVSTDIELVRSGDGRDCARLIFGDEWKNICMAVSVEYSGEGYVQIVADALLNRGGRLEKDGWRNIYTTKEWIEIDPEKPITLTVSHVEGDQLLLITLMQDGNTLMQEFSQDVHLDILDVLAMAGLGVHDSYVKFSGFTIEDME